MKKCFETLKEKIEEVHKRVIDRIKVAEEIGERINTSERS